MEKTGKTQIAMKKHSSLQPLLQAAYFAAVLTLLSQSARAEDKSELPSTESFASRLSRPPGYALEIVDGQFEQKGKRVSATLGNVVDALRDRYPKANIVLAPGLAKLPISDLKLRAGCLADELEAIRVAGGLKFEWLGPGAAGPNLSPGSSPQTIDPTTGQLAVSPQTEANAGLFILREPTPTPETARTMEAFNIGGYLQWLREKQDPKAAPDRREQEVAKSLDELEKIVAVTLESLKQGSSVEMPTFRFHRGANLLIVTGTRDAVEVARQVVNALPQPSSPSSLQTGTTSGIGVPGISPEVSEAFRKRYGLMPAPPAPRAPAPPR